MIRVNILNKLDKSFIQISGKAPLSTTYPTL